MTHHISCKFQLPVILYFYNCNMDVLSHGLWGGIAFGRKHKKSFLLAFSFGVAPDLLSFGIYFVERIFDHNTEWKVGPPDPSLIPEYVYHAYDVTHSLVIFALVFLVSWLILRKPVFEMFAWALHVLMDIFTHSTKFFPTPFLWPLADYRFDGISWGHPAIFFPNVALLALAYLWYFRVRRKKGRFHKK